MPSFYPNIKNGQKIAVMGGTFDPPHNGHIAAARAAKEATGADVLLLVPSFMAPHKDCDFVTQGMQRYDMTRLAALGEKGFAYSNIELRRRGKSYTCDTLSELKTIFPASELWFVMGADSLINIFSWRNPEGIFRLAKLAVIPRPGEDMQELEFAEEKAARMGADIKILYGAPFIDISSTEIRNLAKAGKSIDRFVPAAVAEYIKEHNLYGGEPDGR